MKPAVPSAVPYPDMRSWQRLGVKLWGQRSRRATGTPTLAPAGDAQRTLAEDYQRMVEDGLLLDDAEPFDVLLQRCQALALKVNAAVLGAA